MSVGLGVLGALGDVVMSVATGPLDRVTLVLQTQSLPAAARKGALFEGLRDCTSKLRETGGLLGLWRGSGAEVGKSYAIALSQVALRLVRGPSTPQQGKRRALGKALRSALALVAAYPLTLARTRLAVNADNAEGTLHTWKRVTARLGWRGLYAGVVPEVISDAVHRTLFYVINAGVRHGFLGMDDSPMCRFLGSQIAALLALTAAFPLSTVQARMAVAAGEDDECADWRVCAKKLYKDEGVSGFYHGFLPAWLSQTVKNGLLYNGISYVADQMLKDVANVNVQFADDVAVHDACVR